MKISLTILVTIFCWVGYAQGIKFTCELYVNPTLSKTSLPDRFFPPFSSSAYSLIFGKGNPDIGIIGYNYGGSIGLLIKSNLEFQLTFSEALKGQRNSKDYNPIGRFYDFGMYQEYSDELTLTVRFLNHSIFKVKKFNYIFGAILSRYSLLTIGYYEYNNSWDKPIAGSKEEIPGTTFAIFRPGITTEIEYQLLNDNYFSFNVGLKLNQYFSAFNSDSNSALGGRPRGYAFSIGPSFKLNYHN